MRKWLKRIFLLLALAFVVIQFFRIDKSIPEYNKSEDFIVTTNPPKEVEQLLLNACYDCHSYQTTYPWYAEIAPVSWMIQNHVIEGREHLNFSIWNDYSDKKKDHKLEECVEEIEKNKMPDEGYIKMHESANLRDGEKKLLINYFEELRANL